MHVQPVDTVDPRSQAGASSPARAPDGAFDATLQDALAATPAAPGRLTLGQMLRVYAGPAAARAAAPAPVAGTVPAVPGITAPTTSTGDPLGIGPLARPLPGEVGSAHGMRRHPIHGDVRMHDGVDIGATTGTPIHAFAGGTVTFAGPRGGYGNVVIVEHPGGLETRYAHQSAIDVAVGQRVEAGQVVGRVGATGTATGPHLHFELRRDGASVDPGPYLPAA